MGTVASTQSFGDHAVTVEMPDGRVVASSSQSSARRTESSIAVRCSAVGFVEPCAPSCWWAICAASW